MEHSNDEKRVAEHREVETRCGEHTGMKYRSPTLPKQQRRRRK